MSDYKGQSTLPGTVTCWFAQGGRREGTNRKKGERGTERRRGKRRRREVGKQGIGEKVENEVKREGERE